MKIIRWLLSHIVLVLLIIVVIYGYMFWGRLLDSDTPGGKAISYLSNKFAPADVGTVNADLVNEDDKQGIVAGLNAGEVGLKNLADSTSKDVENTVENNISASTKTAVVNGETSMSAQPSNVSVNDAPSTIQDLTGSAGAVKTNQDTFVSSNTVEQLDRPDEDSVAVDVNNTSSIANRRGITSVNDTQLTIGDAVASASAGASAVETGKDSFVSPGVEEELNNIDGSSEAGAAGESSQLDPKVESADVKASWITARTFYHQRKYELSEKNYQQVIDNSEDNYDAYGELGNVYFNQGKNAQAASAYYEAAVILVRIGQRSRAESLIGLLWRLDPSKADELQKLIDSAAS